MKNVIKISFLDSYFDFFPSNFGAISVEFGELFRQKILRMEKK
jgi:hypothetical protein